MALVVAAWKRREEVAYIVRNLPTLISKFVRDFFKTPLSQKQPNDLQVGDIVANFYQNATLKIYFILSCEGGG